MLEPNGSHDGSPARRAKSRGPGRWLFVYVASGQRKPFGPNPDRWKIVTQHRDSRVAER